MAGDFSGRPFNQVKQMKPSVFNPFFVLLLAILTVMGWAGKRSVIAPEFLCWNGINPFFQPAHTLNFYGSGDIDNNCHLDRNDLDSLNRLISSKATSNYRADINCDGMISNADIAPLQTFLTTGTALPSHWNKLSKEQRVDWLGRCLRLDKTSSIPASADNFVCGNFASQFYLNFSYFGGNLAHTTYTNGGTIFNLPVYSVTIEGHALNSILVGSNPLEFKDWYFIEPQNSEIVDPVAAGQGLTLNVLTYAIQNGEYSNQIVSATRTQDGWTINKTAPGFISQRPPTPPDSDYIDMIPAWNPRAVCAPQSSPIILFERLNDRLPPSTSIYMATIDNNAIIDAAPLIFDTMAARILDVGYASNGTLQLLWRGTSDFRPALFTGTIDIQNKKIKNINKNVVSRLTKAASFSAISSDSQFVFWLTDEPEIPDSPLKQGINQSTLNKGVWSQPKSVEAFSPVLIFASWSQRLSSNYLLTVLSSKGFPIVLTVPQPIQSMVSRIHLRYPKLNDWSDYPLQSDSLVAGARAAIDGLNTVHCIYWATVHDMTRQPEGNAIYRSFSNMTWSEPFILDSSMNNRCTDISVNERNDILTVWEKSISNDRSVFCTRIYANRHWLPACTQYAPDNESVWYPRITALRDTQYIVTWESRGKYTTLIRCKNFRYSPNYSSVSSDKISIMSSPPRIVTRILGTKLFFDTNRSSPFPGTISIADSKGRMYFKTESIDIRYCCIDLRPVGHGLRLVKINSGGKQYTMQMIIF